MSVTAPLRRPSPALADALEALCEEALIKEARQRARRRRQRYAALVAVATVIGGVGAVFALRTDKGGAHPSAAPRPLAPATRGATRSTIVYTNFHRYIGTATLYRIHADGSGLHRLLSRSAAKLVGHRPSWRPALSPDGRQIAFQAGIEVRTAIDVVNLNGDNLRQIALGGVHPSWSPDGTHIAYSLDYQHPQLAVYVIRADGTARHRLTRNAIYPSWSPDGTKLAYICTTPVVRFPEHLCVMNADGTHQHQIAPANPFSDPAWSPDGSKIAFIGGWPKVHVYVINASGSNLRRLPPPVSYKNVDCSPAWSPNGKRIAFAPASPRIDGRTGGIYLMDADGRKIVHLKGTTGYTCGITWKRTPA